MSDSTLTLEPVTPVQVASARHPHAGLSILAVLTAMAAVVLDAGMANVALPAFAATLDTTPARAIWIVTAYQAGLVMALLPAGALGERFGYRRVFTAGLTLFGLGAIGSATSPSWPVLLGCRLVEGLGGAAVMALGVALLRFAVPRERFGSAIGWNALTVALASSAAPSVGAAIASAVECRWIFVASLPLAAVSLAAAPLLPDSPRGTARPDAVSMVLTTAAVALFVSSAHEVPTRTMLAVGLSAAAALLATLAVRRERHKTEPLIPLDLLGQPAIRLAVLASICCFAGQTAGLLTLPFHLEYAFGATAATTGLYMTAWPVSAGVAALFAGRLSDRMPTGVLCAIGALVLAIGLAGFCLWPEADGPVALVPFIAMCGIGFGLFQTPNNRTMFLSAPESRSGAAGGLQGSARVSGQTAGALLTSVLFVTAPHASAPAFTFAVAACAALLAGAISLTRGLHPGA